MTSVGSILRRKRETDGASLERIAESLCIASSHLHALEADDVAHFPGTFFYKSFTLQYATALGLDAESLRSEVDELCGPKEPEQPAHIEPTIQIASRTSSAFRRFGWSLALGLAACAAVGVSSMRNHAPVIVSATLVPAPLAASQVADVVAPVLALGPEVLAGPSATPDAVLSLEARETTWLSITSQGKEIFEGILWPRQSKTLTGLDMARMKVGNAGGLDVSWKGKPVGPIGEAGEVRVVVFSEDDVEVLPPGQSL